MYTIKQAGARAGVSVALLRAWERRYGIVQPERTPGGYRLYDETAISRLRAMRDLIDAGWATSQAAREILEHGIPPDHDRPGRDASRGQPGAGASGGESSPPPVSSPDRTRAFVEAATALDEALLDAVLDELFAQGSFEHVVDDLLFPALRALGDAWAAGTLSVGAEHAASHAVLRRLSAAFEAAGRPMARSPVLVGLPPGSRHELAALAFATALRRVGLPVVYLGADVPEQAWIDAIRRTRAPAIVVAMETARDRGPANRVLAAARAVNPGMLLAVGGRAAVQTTLPESVLLLPDSIAHAAARLERALPGMPG